MNQIFHGKWIQPQEGKGYSPLSLFHRENDPCPTPENAHPEELKNLHMLTRGSFFLNGKEERVLLRLTADDYYKLKVNGEFVAQGPVPGYYFCYYWNEVDITPWVQPGENCLELDVYYQGLINRVWNSGDLRMGMVCDVLADGKVIACTDESWEYTLDERYVSRRTVGYDTQYLEDVDCRIQNRPYRKVWVNPSPDYTFSPMPQPVLQWYVQEPKIREQLDSQTVFYDFGQELTGHLILEAEGDPGESITILCGEETEDAPQKTRWQMRCGCDYQETLTLSGGVCRVEQYDYKAFRYVTLIASQGAKVHSLQVRVRHWPFDDTACILHTSDKVLQEVFQLCKNGVKYGAQEVLVDCPSREKGQYAGDMTITTASHYWLTGDTSLLKKAMENQMQSAVIDPGLMAVTPGSLMQEIADYSLQFPILVRRYWEITGDRDFTQKALAAAEAMLRSFRSYARPDGLLEAVTGKWNLVDWPDNLRDGYDFPLTRPVGPGCHNVVNAFYVNAVKVTEELEKELGLPCKEEFPALRDAFQQAFYDPQTHLYRDSESSSHASLHANAIPAYAGIVPEEGRETIAAFLKEKGLCCGVYMAWFVLKGLCCLGHWEDAYQLIVSTGEHSWYNMVREGGTTCFEAWGKEQKWNTSLCHPWASGPISVLMEDILGLHPDGSRGESHAPKDLWVELRWQEKQTPAVK